MMWIVSTTEGCFEGVSKKKTLAKMVKYYGERNQEAGTIEAIFLVKNNGEVDEICEKVTNKIQKMLNDEVEEWRIVAASEYRGRREIESEIRGAIYG